MKCMHTHMQCQLADQIRRSSISSQNYVSSSLALCDVLKGFIGLELPQGEVTKQYNYCAVGKFAFNVMHTVEVGIWLRTL